MHTFYASIDTQLFIIGVLGVYLLAKRPTLGFAYCITWSVIGNILLFRSSIGIQSPVFFDYDPSLKKSYQFLDTVHFSIYGHIHNYFFGILIAYGLKHGWRLYPKQSRKMFVVCNGISFFFLISFHYLPAVHNVFHLVPAEYFPHYILLSKWMFGLCWGLIAITVQHYHEDLKLLGKTSLKEALVEGRKDSVGKDESDSFLPNMNYSVVLQWISKVFSEIFFSAHMVNLIIIRHTFMTTRVHLSMEVFSVVNRAIITLINSVVIGLLFHLYFSAPFESIRKAYFYKSSTLDRPGSDNQSVQTRTKMKTG